MKQLACALFDMDGVMIDTEPQYDKFWQHKEKKLNLGIQNFEKKIKGTTLPNILDRYFSDFEKEDVDKLVAEIDEFEANMDFPEIPGALKFVKELKNQGIKVGLVTSSTDTKMENVNNKLFFNKLFDVIITASDIEHGKPAPDCYLIAAQKLDVDPKNCIVFEDSFSGIEAGNSAGMTVVGLATTNSRESLKGKTKYIIPDFEGFTLEELGELL